MQVQTCTASTAVVNCQVKTEAAALSVRAQRCQSHYDSTTPSTYDILLYHPTWIQSGYLFSV